MRILLIFLVLLLLCLSAAFGFYFLLRWFGVTETQFLYFLIASNALKAALDSTKEFV